MVICPATCCTMHAFFFHCICSLQALVQGMMSCTAVEAYLVCNPEDVGRDVPDAYAQENKDLHNVACHQGIIASRLEPIVQGIAKAQDAHTKQNHILPCVAKLHSRDKICTVLSAYKIAEEHLGVHSTGHGPS